ncbi:hypothetical protein DENIS_4285 [Desulfonema ishimotonii]|uniref:Uncharacterized protein n=1 Tax=Desulfonema ishimotonii TaxID=45657 RepID=A0A401G2A5_9BACT|nr:hypothetical protein [Desulfonema ishimotonii]GBC63291.1 hypothetical protein DENIS_4285 [Desulfonema ishimotonii]
MLCSIAKLGDEKVESIRKLEEGLGKSLLAFSCHDLQPVQLSDDELAKIQKLEGELGLSLVAVSA